MRLVDEQGKRSQNLHFIRFLAAIAVMFFHAFSIATGDSSKEWITCLTNGQMNCGMISVSIFFLVGGFLIAKSMQRLRTGKAFFKARISRLLPPLLFVNIAVVIAGAFFSKYTIRQYFGMVDTWKYLLNSVLILTHNLPGVFSDNIYLPTVNGSLWTLPVEVLCYIACFVIYKLGFMSKDKFKITLPLSAVFFLLLNYVGNNILIIKSMVRPCMLFYIGILFWIYRDRIILKTRWAVFAAIGLFGTICCGFANMGMIVFFPYIVFVLCFAIKQVPKYIGDLGNYSYGMYLWGFPVQQAITDCMGGEMNPYLNFLVAFPIVIILAIVTYLLTEKTN